MIGDEITRIYQHLDNNEYHAIFLSDPHGHECHVLDAEASERLRNVRAVYRPFATSPLGLPTGGHNEVNTWH